MNPFAIVIICTIGFILFRRQNIHQKYRSLFSLTVAIEINSIAGYFVIFKGKELDYSDIALLVTSIVAFFCLILKNRMKRNQLLLSLLFAGIILAGVFHTIISTPTVKIIDYRTNWDAYLYGYTEMTEAVIASQTVLMLIRVALFLLNSYIVLGFDKNTILNVTKVCKNCMKLHIVYALAEAATKYILRSNALTIFRNAFFGLGGSTQSSFQTRGAGIEIYGWTREASHLAEVMFLFWALCILTKDLRKQKIWLILAGVIMVLSMSFSTVMYAACIAVLFVAVYRIKASRSFLTIAFLGIVLLGGLGYVVLNNKYYMGRLSGFVTDAAAIFSGKSSFSREMVTSSKVRLLGMSETMKAFFERPLLGIGLGTAYCNSGIVSLLSNIGVAGTLAWIYYCLRFGDRDRKPLKLCIVFLAMFILPNILKGGMGMLYATHNLLFILLIRYDKYGTCADSTVYNYFNNEAVS
jgi:hypothetical protein